VKTIKNTLKIELGRFDDPGDYPSGAGGGPLASRDFVESIGGTLIIELESEDFASMETETPTVEQIQDFIIDNPPDADFPGGTWICWSVDQVALPHVTLSVEDFDADGSFDERPED
jgi:hypothetical protein